MISYVKVVSSDYRHVIHLLEDWKGICLLALQMLLIDFRAFFSHALVIDNIKRTKFLFLRWNQE